MSSPHDPAMLPDWARSEVGQPLSTWFRIHASSLDGNCFFDSIRIILKSVDTDRSVQDLRHVVASPVLDAENEIVNKTIQNWIELYKGAASSNDSMLMEEYKHVGFFKDVPMPLSAEHRTALYNIMMTPMYWGEHHACRMIEEQSRMRFLIFCEDTRRPQLNWYHSKSFKPEYYCFLYLRHQHYMPISFQGRFVFRWEEIPHQVQLFFTKAYQKPK
jgi:hypothetical protein